MKKIQASSGKVSRIEERRGADKKVVKKKRGQGDKQVASYYLYPPHMSGPLQS